MRVFQLDKNFEFNQRPERANIIDILHYIELHYGNCTLTSVAKEFNFNPNYLGNMLKERTGKKFIELVQMQRMIQASTMLINTDKKIDEIAYEIGYESTSFLYRKFKEHFGQTPHQFRKKQ
jgi:YesN/AraC family two-component response regulator